MNRDVAVSVVPGTGRQTPLSFPSTKIQPPRLRSGLLPRDALAAHIAQGLMHSRLTLVSAAGGFGKSSAMALALAAEAPRLRCAWIACDEDDTAARLCAALVAALEPFDLPWRLSPEALIASLEAEGLRSFRDALVNALVVTEVDRAVIVLDDVHHLVDGRVLEFLATLPQALPDHWGLVLLTRVDPPWSLARLRVAGELTEIRQDELRFAVDEIASLARQAGQLDAAPALLARTEGWPVGVTLALANPHAAAPVRSARHAIDYLRSEVLDNLPAGLRWFLVQTSVLPEFTAARAAAVTGRADSAACMDEIERRGLFFQEVDSAERTLRLHDLFREALAAERQRLPAAERDALWRHAADSETDPLRRFDYQLQASAHDAAVLTLTSAAPSLIAAGMIDAVQAMLRKLPPPLLADAPEIDLLRGMIDWENVDFQAMQAHMKDALRAFSSRGDRAGSDLARAYVALALNAMSPIGNPRRDPAYDVAVDDATPARTRVIVALHRAWHAFDLADFEATNRHYEELLDSLTHDRDAALWYQVAPGMAYFGVRALEPLLCRYAEGALRVAGEDYPALRAMALTVRGAVALWHGDLAAARPQFDEAASLCAWLNYPHVVSVYSLIGRLLCRTAQGEIEPALAVFHEELTRVSGMAGPDGRGPGWYFRWFELRCCLTAERPDLARRALEALLRAMPASVSVSHTGVARVIESYRAWLGGEPAQAAALMRDALVPYGQNDAVGIVTTLNLQRAGLCLQSGNEAEAAEALRDALDGVRLRGYALSARLAGDGLLRQLADSALVGALDAAQAATLDSLLPTRSEIADARPQLPVACGDAEPISPRELDVLALLADGDSNKVIARRLDLSPHTVKRHVANILGKLSLVSRGQAAAWYRGQRA